MRRLDVLCLGEPMLEFNQLPPDENGRALYLEGHGGDTSNAAIAAARAGARAGYVSAIGRDAPGRSFLALWAAEGGGCQHGGPARGCADGHLFRDAWRAGA
ncbi:PfkB family carbohydrate kinase [Pseudoroseomonas cervicalis]|uniref:PfkB family carbohydrate kinase n=1 Tax=Teichococcus cervicalis TaxID=204525 RepID=UPI0035E84F85